MSGPVLIRDVALLTDLYELTMAASYFREGMAADATFSLFVRKLPPTRGFLIAAGLADVLALLEGFEFSDKAIAYLASLERFEPAFLEFLRGIRFTGEVRAVPRAPRSFPTSPCWRSRRPSSRRSSSRPR